MQGSTQTLMRSLLSCICAAPPVLNSWSHTGFWAAKDIMPQNHGAGTIYYIGSGLWALEWLWSMYTLKVVYSGFRGKNQGRAVTNTVV